MQSRHRRQRALARVLLLMSVAPLVWGITGGRSALRPVDIDAGLCRGTARLDADPMQAGRVVNALVSMNGLRYRARASGFPGRRLLQRHAGEAMQMSGVCRPLTSTMARFDRVRHVAGVMSVSFVSEEWNDASLLARSSNRVRDMISRGARVLPPDDRALFLGLVIGDDRLQPRAMVEQFRESGLAHLTAVSGQNVAYVVAIAGLVVRRLRPTARLLATVAVIGWFVVMTRAEPSVVRAAAMAIASAVCFTLGIRFNARMLFPHLVLVLLVVDPMLAHSVGFALSVGATLGLVWMSAPLSRTCGDTWWGRHLATTIAASCGTGPVSLLVFGHVSVISLVCNPLAVPVAGFVMLCGIPAAALGAVLPTAFTSALMFPFAVGVRLVWWVANIGSMLSPHGTVNALCWSAVIAVVVVVSRRRAVAG